MSGMIFMKPIDGWSFRDGKPFEAGEAFEAASLFPPSPWSTAGCIRTTLLRRLCADPEKYAGRGRDRACPKCGNGPCAAIPELGHAGAEPPFPIGAPLLATGDDSGALEVFYPTPRDLVLEDRGTDLPRLPHIIAPLEVPSEVSSSLDALNPIGLKTGGRLYPFEPNHLGTADLSTYLRKEIPSALVKPPCVFSEPRIGVGIDPSTRSAREGRLYIRDLLRLDESAGLAVSVGCDHRFDRDIGRLGGDGRMVSLNSVKPVPLPEMPLGFKSRFKVYLASPTYFENGWHPKFIDPATLEGPIPGTTAIVKLIGAAMAESRPVGGWDLKSQQPRRMDRLVSSGSVFYFETLQGNAENVAKEIHGYSFCDDQAMSKAGFGLAFVGRW